MANLREIKNRIESVTNTRKITNAMYLIASTKLQKAQAELEKTKPYFRLQESEMRRIFRRRNDINSHYFYPETGRKPAESYAYLVITADKGLAGAYNHNILKLAEQEMARHKKVHLFVVGEYGRQYFMRRHIHIDRSFLYTAQNPTFRRAREISNVLLDLYNRHKVDEILSFSVSWSVVERRSYARCSCFPLSGGSSERWRFIPARSGRNTSLCQM